VPMASHMNEFDKFRFGVFEGDLFSNLWLAFNDGNEFYLGVRSLMGRVKVSFHSTGVCHMKVAHRQSIETRPRWKRPPTPLKGALHFASVCFPGGYNKGFRPASGTPKKKLFGIRAAPEGKMIEFGFFFSREPMDVLEQMLSQVGLPMVHMAMPNGDAVSVVSRLTELNEESLAALRNLSVPVEAVVPEIEPGGRLENVSGFLINEPSEMTPINLTSIQGFNLTRRSPG